MMFLAAIFAIFVTMALILFRALVGPTVFDRILAVNSFGTLTVVLISLHGFYMGRPEFLDLALVYALINFIGTIAVSKYVTFSRVKSPVRHNKLGDI